MDINTKKTKNFDELEEQLRYNLIHCDLFTVEKARQDIVDFLMPLIKKYATKYISKSSQHSVLTFDDYVNEAAVRVLTKIDDFKMSKGVKLATFFTYQIVDSMQQLKTSMEPAYRTPTSSIKIQAKLIKERQKEPDISIEELSKKYKISKERVFSILETNQQQASVFQTVAVGGDERELLDTIESEAPTGEDICVKQKSKFEYLKLLKELLNDDEFIVLTNRFGLISGETKTLEEIRNCFNKSITKERVRQIQNQALAKINASSKKDEIISSIKYAM